MSRREPVRPWVTTCLEATMTSETPLLSRLFARRNNTLLTATADALSRLYLPPAEIAMAWPAKTGQIRAAGKMFYVFYAAACLAWMSLSLVLCLLLRLIASLVARIYALAPIRPIRNPPEDIAMSWLLSFIHAGSPWLHVVTWSGVALTLYAVQTWSPRCRFTRFGEKIGARIFITSLLGWVAAFALAVQSLYVAAFPGLFEGSVPRAVVPWWAWFAAAWALLIYRGSSQNNPRLREFSSEFYRRALMHDFPIHRLLHGHAARFWVSMRTRHHDAPIEDYERLKREEVGWLTFHELEVLTFHALSNLKAFYEREGLDTLLRPTNPERRFYTARQRDEFDKTYVTVVESLAYREHRVRLLEEHRLTSLNNTAGTRGHRASRP